MPLELDITPGSKVAYNAVAYIISENVDGKHVMGIQCGTKSRTLLPILELKPVDDIYETAPSPNPEGMPTVSEEKWAVAEHRKQLLEPLLAKSHRTRSMVEEAAKQAGVSIATIYNWIRRYNASGVLSALLDEENDGGRGKSRLSPEVEAIIDTAVRIFYLEKRKSIKRTFQEIGKQCQHANMAIPHINTVYRRIGWLTHYDKLVSTKGVEVAEQQSSPKPGLIIGADTLLSMVQIDHMKLDIEIVDDRDRLPIGRAWLTLAIDVFSRMVIGMYVSLDPPTAFSASMCLIHALLPKDVWLQKLGVEADWPCWGKMVNLHMDNAREFRGNLIRRVCREYSIDPIFRPVKKPRYGAYIERLLGTVAEELKSLPGATFSNPAERGKSKPEVSAALTFNELEAYLANYFAGDYHQRIHSELGMSPIMKRWEGINGSDSVPARGNPAVFLDEYRVYLDFLPYFERTIQAYGIQWEHIHYYHDVLRPWFNVMDPEHPKEHLKFRFHYDPRNISTLYFFDPKVNRYFKVPYRDPRYKPISKWDRDAAKRKLAAEGAENVDDEMIFRTHEKLHALEQNAIKETKRIRRARQVRTLHGKAPLVKPEGKPKISASVPSPDIYTNIEPFEDIDA